MIEFETDDFLYRSVVVHPRQSKELSLNTCKVRTVQKYFYNKGVQFGMNDKYEVGNTITDFHCNVMWSNKFHTNVETTAFQQGYDAINNLLKNSRTIERSENWERKRQEKTTAGQMHLKPNEWTDINDIFCRYKCESINDIILANDPTTDNSGGDVISGGRGDRHETGESGSGLHLDGPTIYGDNRAVEDPIIEHGDNQAV